MSTRPEAGQEEAQEDDGSNLQRDHEAEQELSHESLLDVDLLGDDISHESEISEPTETKTSHQEADIRSIDSLQEQQSQNANVQLMEDTQNADDISSVPDDTLSVQVPFADPSCYFASTHMVRVPCSLPTARHSHFDPLGPALNLPHLEDRLIVVFILVCHHQLWTPPEPTSPHF